jgi:NPCBM/NEW2 domain
MLHMVQRLRQIAWVMVCASSVLHAASVAPLEGEPLHGPEVRFDGDQVHLAGQTVALAACDWVQLVEPSSKPVVVPPARMGLWLADGGWLPGGPLLTADGPDAVVIDGPLGRLRIGLDQIAAFGTSAPDAPADGDDRVVLASGPVDGRIRGIRDGKLLLASSLDPEPLAIDLGDIAGLRIAAASAAARTATSASLLATLDPQRPPLRLMVQGAGLAVAFAGTAAQPIDTAALGAARLVVDGPQRTWLSDLTPSAVEERGAFDVVWPWAKDAAIGGGPLMLGGMRHAKGLTVHSAARLSWPLNGAYRRLRVVVGIADAFAPEGDCPVRIELDGTVRWTRDRLRGGDAPVPVDLDLSGAQQLTLIIDLGERYDIGDHVVLGSAYLVRAR